MAGKIRNSKRNKNSSKGYKDPKNNKKSSGKNKKRKNR